MDQRFECVVHGSLVVFSTLGKLKELGYQCYPTSPKYFPLAGHHSIYVNKSGFYFVFSIFII